MDEVLLLVKQQIDVEKEISNKNNTKVSQRKPLQKKNQTALNTKEESNNIKGKSKNDKSNKPCVGTFGRSERKTFCVKESPVDFLESPDRSQTRVLGGYISKIPRTQQSKPKNDNPELLLNPNYNYCKKSVPAPIVAAKPFQKPTMNAKKVKDREYFIEENFEHESISVSTVDTEFSEFFREKSLWDQKIKNTLQNNPELVKIQFPAPVKLYESPRKPETSGKIPKPEKNVVGPGSYLLSYALTERNTKVTKFPKSPRLKEQKPINDLPLFPNYAFVHKSIPGVKIVPASEKSSHLLQKESEENKREILKALLYKIRNLDLPESVVERIKGGIIAPLSDIPVRYPNNKLGPGRYELNYFSIEPEVHGKVKYFIPEFTPVTRQKALGPGHYDLEDDPHIIGGFIPVSPRSRSLEIDRRKALDPNTAYIKPMIPSAFIPPEHIDRPVRPDYLGPGKYTPSYALVEKRTDIDVLPFVQTKEKEPEIDNRLPLVIKDDLVRPGIPGFLYHEPVEVLPPHLPDKYFHFEHWRFYDVDADNKFDRVPEASFAPAEFLDFKDYEIDREALARINKKLRGEINLPSVGTYEPEPVKERPPAYDFGKAVSRDPTYNGDVQDEEREGDILILEPHKNRDKVKMLVNMEKNSGRPEPVDDSEYENRLLLEPNIDYIKKKPMMLVNMAKNTGRPEEINEETEQLDLNPNYFIAKKNQVMLVNMEKQQGRDPEVLEPEETVVILPEEPKKEFRSGVNMSRQTGREEFQFDEDVVMVGEPTIINNPSKPKVLGIPNFARTTGRESEKEPDLENEIHTSKNALPDIGNAYRAIDPEPKAPSFARYVPRMQEISEEADDIPFVDTRKKSSRK